MWKRALVALDIGVTAMARDGSVAPLQARQELAGAVATVYAVLKDGFELEELQQVWKSSFISTHTIHQYTLLILSVLAHKATHSTRQHAAVRRNTQSKN
jgi:hypothetical protein